MGFRLLSFLKNVKKCSLITDKFLDLSCIGFGFSMGRYLSTRIKENEKRSISYVVFVLLS
jgi:hypothetical protein